MTLYEYLFSMSLVILFAACVVWALIDAKRYKGDK